MKTNYNSAIGEWLMHERIRQGLSLQDVADRLQVSKSAVYYWEVGKRTIFAENNFLISSILLSDSNSIS